MSRALTKSCSKSFYIEFEKCSDNKIIIALYIVLVIEYSSYVVFVIIVF